MEAKRRKTVYGGEVSGIGIENKVGIKRSEIKNN